MDSRPQMAVVQTMCGRLRPHYWTGLGQRDQASISADEVELDPRYIQGRESVPREQRGGEIGAIERTSGGQRTTIERLK
jgi:hypothetical protein